MAIDKLKIKDGYEGRQDKEPIDYVQRENDGKYLEAEQLQESQARLAGKTNEILVELDAHETAGAGRVITQGSGILVDTNTEGKTIISLDKSNPNFMGFVTGDSAYKDTITDSMFNGRLVTTNYPNGIETTDVTTGQYFEVINSTFLSGATFTKEGDDTTTDIWFVNGFVNSQFVSSTDFESQKSKTDAEIVALKTKDVAHETVDTQLASRITANETGVANLVAEVAGHDSEIKELKTKANTAESKDLDQDIKLNSLESDSTTHKSEIEQSKQDIIDNASAIGGIRTSKQNVTIGTGILAGVEVEKAIADNKVDVDLLKTNEKTFVTKQDGEMAVGYTSSVAKSVIPKDEFDTAIAKKEAELNSLSNELSKKANVTDLGQKPLIYIPGQGASDTDTVTPVIPTVNGGQLEYTFDASDWSAWKSRFDHDGKLLINGIEGNIGIKDNSSTTYPAEESYNNGSATKIPFGTDADAQWNLNDGSLIIITNAQNRDVTRTLRQITFLVESQAGALVDQTARDMATDNTNNKQNKSITKITGMNATTVEGALAELKNAKDALEDVTKEQSTDGTTTKFTTDIEAGGTLSAKNILKDGEEVVTLSDVIPTIDVDDTSTVKSVVDKIKLILVNEGKATVLLQHNASTQGSEKYEGTIEIIDNDPLSWADGKAYFIESNFNKFSDSDTVEKYMFQDFLNPKGYDEWKGNADGTTTEAVFELLTIKDVRREIPVKIFNENVLIDDIEEASLTTLETLVNDGIHRNVIPNPAPPEENDDFLVNEINRFGGGLDD